MLLIGKHMPVGVQQECRTDMTEPFGLMLFASLTASCLEVST
jgi:hypothetical protein